MKPAHFAVLLLLAAPCRFVAAQHLQANIPYANPAHERHVLDIYTPAAAASQGGQVSRPVVFWIHGGGWQTGDKSDVQIKPQVLTERGYVFVSTNYRLLPDVDMETLIRDVAMSLGWVHKNIAKHGGDPGQIYVMGHSAGAQLAALLCVDERYLKEQGVPFSALRGCVPVDGDTYDIPAIITTAELRQTVHQLPLPTVGHRVKFGGDPRKHVDFSAVTHVAADKGIPPFLILHVAGQPDVTAQAKRFGAVLEAAGVPTRVYGARESTHRKLNGDLGKPGDGATAELYQFLARTGQTRVPASAGANSEATRKIVAAVQPYVDRQELAGAVMLVADRQGIVCHGAVGFADVEAKQAMRPDAMFWIASQSKPITAAAVMMLVDEGKLSLDDPVEKHLPEFAESMVVVEQDAQQRQLRRPRQTMLVRHLLSHTSGLPFRSALEVPTLDRLPLADRVRSYAMTPLDHEPASKYQYSNAGINTAARIIEVISGQSFEQFLDERLLKPLGMHDTTFWPTDEQVARIAKSYQPGPEKRGLAATTISQLQYPLSDTAGRTPMPAGGLFSTATDMVRFYRMLANGGQLDGRRYLSEEAVSQLTTKQTPEGVPTEYGLGFSTGGDRFGHGGAYSTNSYFDRKHGLIFIWLVQHAGFPGEGGKAQETFRQAAIEALGR
ncbi:MAG: serine hydrolase [Planctomycetales bacterium]|nr:serine hydrolase [Planctomycetales bacterium]